MTWGEWAALGLLVLILLTPAIGSRAPKREDSFPNGERGD
jgi:hypothetical protein